MKKIFLRMILLWMLMLGILCPLTAEASSEEDSFLQQDSSVQAAAVQRPATPVVTGRASNNVVTLSWKQVKNASGYQLYLYYPSTGKYKSVSMITSGSKVSLKLTGSLNHTYTYRMRAYTQKNGVKTFGKLTNPLSVKTAPSKAVITSLKSQNSMTATVQWGKISTAEGYQIFRAESDGAAYTRIKTISGSGTVSYVDTSVKQSGTYYYKVRAYRKNGAVCVYGASSAGKSLKVQKSKLIFVGDSRTVSLSKTISSSNVAWICKSSMGYTWFRDTAIPKVEKLQNPESDICIWLGVNDVYNIYNYISLINQKVSEWSRKGSKTYIIAVGPVENDPYVTNKEIRSFNSKMQAGIVNASYIDLYSYLVKQGYKTLDGTHYNSSTDTKIYDYIMGQR